MWQYELLGTSPQTCTVRERVTQLARLPVAVVIVGPTGTGKYHVARLLWELAGGDRPFQRLSPGQLSQGLIAAELLGWVRGAFTGAVTDRAGLIELAALGILFVDDLQDLPRECQMVLLDVLERRPLKRLGGARVYLANLRLVVGSQLPLAKLVASGKLREDLFYRMKRAEIELPALRERPEDIEAMIDPFLEETRERFGLAHAGVSAEARRLLLSYDWPGNVRELQGALEVGLAFAAAEGGRIEPHHLPPELAVKSGRRIRTRTKALSARRLVGALKSNGFCVRRAARALGVPERSVWRRTKKLGINLDELRAS